MMFLLEKYWSHWFLLCMPTKFLQSHTHTHTHTHIFTDQMTKLLSEYVKSIYITISITWKFILSHSSKHRLFSIFFIFRSKNCFSFALCDILPIFKCTLYRILNLSLILINYFLNLFTNFNLWYFLTERYFKFICCQINSQFSITISPLR